MNECHAARSYETGELYCPHGDAPPEDGDWHEQCDDCELSRVQWAERMADCERDEAIEWKMEDSDGYRR